MERLCTTTDIPLVPREKTDAALAQQGASSHGEVQRAIPASMYRDHSGDVEWPSYQARSPTLSNSDSSGYFLHKRMVSFICDDLGGAWHYKVCIRNACRPLILHGFSLRAKNRRGVSTSGRSSRIFPRFPL